MNFLNRIDSPTKPIAASISCGNGLLNLYKPYVILYSSFSSFEVSGTTGSGSGTISLTAAVTPEASAIVVASSL